MYLCIYVLYTYVFIYPFDCLLTIVVQSSLLAQVEAGDGAFHLRNIAREMRCVLGGKPVRCWRRSCCCWFDASLNDVSHFRRLAAAVFNGVPAAP